MAGPTLTVYHATVAGKPGAMVEVGQLVDVLIVYARRADRRYGQDTDGDDLRRLAEGLCRAEIEATMPTTTAPATQRLRWWQRLGLRQEETP